MQVVLLLGSNQGNKRQLLSKALELLSTAGKPVRISSLYETEPWGFECNENFLNQAAVFDTLLSPLEFLDRCQQAERQLGRIRTGTAPRYSSRPIDIDILFYESLILDTPRLVLPHPRLHERNFALNPLKEILPHFVHPVLRQTISEIAIHCPDRLKAKKLTD